LTVAFGGALLGAVDGAAGARGAKAADGGRIAEGRELRDSSGRDDEGAGAGSGATTTPDVVASRVDG
jgi:hypothetical protein